MLKRATKNNKKYKLNINIKNVGAIFFFKGAFNI